MKLVAKGKSTFDHIIDFLALLAGAIIIIIWLIVCLEVIMRYSFNRPTIWVLEITEYGLVYLTFLGATWLVKRDGHVRIDLVVNQLNPKNKVFLALITSVIGAIVCLVVACISTETTWSLFQRGIYAPTVLEPPKFLIVAVVPVASFLLFIQFLRLAYGHLRNYRAINKQRAKAGGKQ